MALAKLAVVIIHGSHHALVDGKRVKHEVGEEVELHKEELARLDPLFKNGKGERFASPEIAAKLQKKREIEEELAQADAEDEDEGDEPEVDDDAAEQVTTEPDEVPVAPAAKKKAAAKKKGA